MARVLKQYYKIAQGAASNGRYLAQTAVLLGVGGFAAVAWQGGNLKIELPNGPQGLLVPGIIFMIIVLAVYSNSIGAATSKGDPIEPDSSTSADELLQPAPTATVVEETRRSSETVTIRRDETPAGRGEQDSNDPLKRRGGAPEPVSQEAGTGRTNQGQDRSRGPSSQTGDERQSASPKPALQPAPAQPAAPSTTVTATATVVGGDGPKDKVLVDANKT